MSNKIKVKLFLNGVGHFHILESVKGGYWDQFYPEIFRNINFTQQTVY